jgi:hypothetical protein
MGEYDHTQYSSGKVYPLQNPIKRGYGVADPDINPADRQANARMTNQKGEDIDFWVEEITANFAMTGSTAQSRNVRQFIPHNVVQPTITVSGRAPNQFQYNRMASFVRASHYTALHQGEQIRETITPGGKKIKSETVRLLVRNGSQPGVWNAQRTKKRDGDRRGKRVKGIHVPWLVEGYIKSMKAGGERFNPAPQFQFEFFVAESTFKQGNINMGMWEDVRVYGSELKPWLDWISKSGNFVTVKPDKASSDNLNGQEKERNSGNNDNLPKPGSVFDVAPPFGEAINFEEAEDE